MLETCKPYIHLKNILCVCARLCVCVHVLVKVKPNLRVSQRNYTRDPYKVDGYIG